MEEPPVAWEDAVVHNGEQGPDGSTATPDDVLLRLRRAARRLQDFLAAGAKEHGLSSTEFSALIRSNDAGGITGAELARALGMRSSSVTGLADRLEAKGLITRGAHPHDRRAVVLLATRRGRGVVRRAIDPLPERLGVLAEEFDDDERTLIAAFLDRIDEALA
jgi:DNA-binding MarR family transcriptional regulator